MVYQNKMVVAVKVDGKILRESEGGVAIPFGSEYSVLLKNLNSVKTLVKVSVDGTDATEGTWLILEPNSSLDLERYIRAGNLKSGNKFKFIARTKSIENHRGIKADDGLIRVEYKTEKQKPISLSRVNYYDVWEPWQWPYGKPWYQKPWVTYSSLTGSLNANTNVSFSSTITAQNCNLTKCSADTTPTMDSSFSDEGITVPGSESNQQFSIGQHVDTHEQSEVIILKLRGEVLGKPVVKAVTAQSKPKCTTCGRNNKGTARFCAQCGTALQLI